MASPTASHRTHKTSELEGCKFGDNAFEINDFIAAGSFGTVHKGRHLTNNEPVAIKLEMKSAPDPSLHDELGFIKALQRPDRPPSIPRFIYYGQIGDWNALVLELFGANLKELHIKCDTIFTVKTTIQILVQIIDIFAYVHSKNIVYRDVKPANFLIGRSGTGPGQEKIIRLVDFGLCKYFIVNGHHIAYKNDRTGMIGTLKYASINSHEGVIHSRRDDLESLAYMAIFFLKGKLPWLNVICPDPEDELYRPIGECKKNAITTGELSQDLPQEFRTFLIKVRSLRFDEKPDYDGYKKLFKDLFDRSGLQDDNVYDWEDKELAKNKDSGMSKEKSKKVQDQERVQHKSPRINESEQQNKQQRDNKKMEKKKEGENKGLSKKKPSKSPE